MGKSKSAPAPPPVQQPQPIDIGAIMEPMMKGMSAMMAMASKSSAPQYTPPPPIPEPTSVDWVKKQEDLQKQMTEKAQTDLRKKRGRASTVLTSPLVEEEEVSTVAAKVTGN